jgi:hypothetical protein
MARAPQTFILSHNIRAHEFLFVTCKAAKTLEEAAKLIEAGFEYVTDVDGVKLFRKRK